MSSDSVQIAIPEKLIPVFNGPADVRGAFGGRGCMRGDTLVITQRGAVPFAEVRPGDDVLSWNEKDQLFQLAPTSGAYRKGKENLCRVITTHGEYYATSHHLVLNSAGVYQQVGDLAVGDNVSACISPLQTMKESSRIWFAEDDLDYWKRASNCQGDYGLLSRHDDRQLQKAIESALSFSQQQACVHKSYRPFLDKDVQPVRISKHNPIGLSFCHQPTQDCLLRTLEPVAVGGANLTPASPFERISEMTRQWWQSQWKTTYHRRQLLSFRLSQCFEQTSLVYGSVDAGKESHFLCKCFAPVFRTIQRVGLYLWQSVARHTNHQPAYDSHHQETFSYCDTPSSSEICTIVSIEQMDVKEWYYDMHVAGNNNYVTADGCIHHNSAKTRTFAKMTAVRGYMYGMAGISGIILCGRQFMNSLDESSMEEIKRCIEEEPFLKSYYEIGEKYIRSKDGRIDYAFAGLDRNIASVKSKGRILLCWIDEAEPVTENAFSILVPTLREEGDDWNAELWVTWNPARKNAAVEKRYRNSSNPLVKVAELNYTDNPKFPSLLERARLSDYEERPDQYPHIWDGKHVSVIEGAYYAKHINDARAQGRVGIVGPDPLMTYRAYCDIGGTGARADAFTMWIAQFVGREIRVMDYYEVIGQPFSAHLEWLRKRKYTIGNTQVYLPHDGDSHDKVYDVSYASAFGDAGYECEVIPNQGKGAASKRIEAGRRRFPLMWFNCPEGADHDTTPTCEAGLEAIGWYHEKKDEKRDIGLGPDHDWSSHGSDSFGLMAVCYELPKGKTDDDWRSKGKQAKGSWRSR